MNSRHQFFLVCIFSIVISISFFSCKKSQEVVEQLPEPQIVAGIAKIHGKLNDPKQQVTSLILRFRNPVTASESIIEAPVEKDGSFYFETPIECSVVFGSIYFPGYRGVLFELFPDEDKNIELGLDYSGKLIINNANGNSLLTDQDKKSYEAVLGKYFDFFLGKQDYNPKMTPKEYEEYEIIRMKDRTDNAMKGAKLSDAGKKFVLNELKLIQARTLIHYKEGAELLFMNSKNKEKSENWSPPDPDIQYYSFLKSFDLNNPQYIFNSYYSKIIQSLLTTKAFDIPLIADTPVEEWLSNVKAILSDLVGFEKGQFYDLLAANSYSMQFNDDVIPLSDKQKNNIKAYFGDGEIAKILLRKNEEIIKLAGQKSAVVVNKTPDVSKEKLMDAIVSKYKNKVVLVDFWATWCGPCLDAMTRIDAIKSRLKDKGVVFVYVTNGSSPKELWDKKINSIPGEHYYVNADEWEYLMKNFGFKYIPSYVIFDSKGAVRHKFTAFPGIETIKIAIEELLP